MIVIFLLSLGGFDPPPPARIRPEMLPLHYNDLFDICPFIFCKIFPSHISVANFIASIFLIYHRVVSINRPSGYEPDALPLRHNDWGCHWVVSIHLLWTR